MAAYEDILETLEELDQKTTKMNDGRLAIIDRLIELGSWDGYDKTKCTLTEIPRHITEEDTPGIYWVDDHSEENQMVDSIGNRLIFNWAYMVKFYSDGILQKSEEVERGHDATPPSVSKTGYTLQGWIPDYKNVISSIDTYAQWKVNQYKLTLNKGTGISSIYHKVNGASKYTEINASTNINVNYDSTWYVYAEPQDGYSYTSTSSSKPQSGVMGTSGAIFSATGTAKTYTVSKYGDNCTLTANSTGTFDSQLQINWSPSSQAGYTFAFSNVKVYSGTSATQSNLLSTYTSGTSAKFTMTGKYYSNIYIKGVYTKTGISYSVSFNANTGTGAMSNQTGFVYGTAKALNANQFTKTGYTFAGWATSASGSVVYADKANMTNGTTTAGDIVPLYAKWNAIVSTVSFNANGGTGGQTTSVKIAYDTAIGKYPTVVSPTAPTGYTFNGYWDAASGGTQYYNSSCNSVRVWDKASTAVTLYAQWTPINYVITVNAGTGGTATGGGTYAYGTVHTITATPSTHYTFTKWSDGNTSASRQITVQGAATYTATFTGNTYTTTFNSNGGSSCASQSKQYPGTITLPTTTLTGYSCNGWYTSASGGTKVGAVGASYQPTKSTTLYAQWTAQEYDVNLDENGGTIH